MMLIAQGMRMWADYADRAANGSLTDADLDAMSAALGTNIEGAKAQLAAGNG